MTHIAGTGVEAAGAGVVVVGAAIAVAEEEVVAAVAVAGVAAAAAAVVLEVLELVLLPWWRWRQERLGRWHQQQLQRRTAHTYTANASSVLVVLPRSVLLQCWQCFDLQHCAVFIDVHIAGLWNTSHKPLQCVPGMCMSKLFTKKEGYGLVVVSSRGPHPKRPLTILWTSSL